MRRLTPSGPVRAAALLVGAAMLHCACATTTPVALALTPAHQVPGPDADVAGVRLGLVSSESHRVIGLDVNGYWGCTDAASGGIAVALGGNEAKNSFVGLQVAGGFNFVQPLWSDAPRTIDGAQVALLANSGDVRGVQLGAWNGLPATHDSRGDRILGMQVGLVDGGGDVDGIQLAGALAWCKRVDGMQTGVFTMAVDVRGCQAGVWNGLWRGEFMHGTRISGAQVGVLDHVGTLEGAQIAALWTSCERAVGLQVSPWNAAGEMCGLQLGLVNSADRGGLQLGLLNFNDHGFLPVFPLIDFGW